MPRVPAALAVGLLLFGAAAHTFAAPAVPLTVRSRAAASEHVVVATIAAVEPVFQTNEHGDRLIVSKAHLLVHESLKGRVAQTLDVDVEGGTVGEVTLAVSDLPRITAGERAVFFVSRNARGRLVPHLRGQSILKLDAQDRVLGSTLSLAALRAEILAAR
jgi:hypothetical protein